jgi:hypothetical protein
MKKISLTMLLSASLSFFSANSLAWDGYDYNTGSYIEIGSGNLVRSGNEIEICSGLTNLDTKIAL